MKWIKRILWIVVAAGIVAGLVYAYLPKPVRAEFARVSRGRMSIQVQTDGRTRVHDRYVISAPLSGQLARIELHAGDEVRADAVLARIVPVAAPMLDPRAREQAEARVRSAEDAARQATASVERARLALEFARTQAARQRDLVARDVAPRQSAEMADLDVRTREAEWASARFASRVAGHEIETARAALGRIQSPQRSGASEEPVLEITAPVSGRVLRLIQQSAGVVAAGTPLLEVGDPAALEIVADVLTADAVAIRPLARVDVDRWGGDMVLQGVVRLVEPSAFTRTSALGVEEQRVNVIVDLVTEPSRWRALGDGYRVETRIETWADDAVLRVPAGSVFRRGAGWSVFVVEGNVAHRRDVEAGRRNGRDVQILRGLRERDTVLVHPSDAIDDGTAVRAM